MNLSHIFAAVVSVKPDNAAAAVQAAAATGQPLLQQSAPQNFVYMQQMVPQPQGYHPSMGQVRPGPEVIKLFSCSTQLSMEFILLINVKMPTSILTFISRINDWLW